MLKKLLKPILLVSIIIWWLWVLWFANALNTNWGGGVDYDPSFPFEKDKPCEWDECIDTPILIPIHEEDSIINRLLWVFRLNNEALSWDHKFIKYVRWILNMALWILSMVALVMTIYTFYLMFFSDNQKWFERAKSNLIRIFIALAVIWLAWLIVSFIFRWYQAHWETALW